MLLLLAQLALAQEPPVEPASPEDPAPEEPSPEEPDTDLKMPVLVEFQDAPYPPEAEAAAVEGQVLLELEIDETGRVVRADVVQAAGHGFDEAAVEAALQFVFEPAEDETGPIPVILEFTYGFTLDAPVEDEDVPPEEAPEPPVNLEGWLIEKGTRAPVGFASVWVQQDEWRYETKTDEEGRWELRGVPLGLVELHAMRPGYDELIEMVEVTEGEVTEVKLWIRSRGTRDNEAVGIYRREETTSVTRRVISVQEVRRVPGTFGDPVRVIQSLPGAARPSFGTGTLIIRGANPEDSRVYIDGVEVPLVFHLGGYRSVINGALIESVDYLPGGYDVRYGRGMGGAVDIRTGRDYPKRFNTTIRTDFLDSSVFTRGAVTENVGVAAGARRSYLDVLLPAFLDDDAPTIKPRWYDYQLKVDRLQGGSDELGLFVFGFQDLLLIQNPEGFSEGSEEEGEDGLRAVYQTHRIVGRWRHALTDTAELMLQPSFGYDSVSFGLGTLLEVRVGAIGFGTRAELRWELNDHWTLRPGLDAGLTRAKTEITIPELPSLGDDPLAESEGWVEDESEWILAPDPFVDLQYHPLEDEDALVFDLGVRASTIVNGKDMPVMALDPRFATRWMVVEGTTLKGGAGFYHQPPDAVATVLDDERYGFQRAFASELGVEQRLADAASVDVTGFYKVLDQLLVDNPDLADPSTDPFYVDTGIGRVIGGEVLLRKEPVGPFFGWLSYTVMQSTRNDYPDETEWYPYNFDQTHIATLVAGYTLPYDFDLSGRFQYVTGNPYTPYEDAIYSVDTGDYTPIPSDARNSQRLPPYYALDVRLSKVWSFKRWQLEGFIDILNLVHGENPESIIYNYDYTEETYVQGLPTIPNLGFQVEFNL